MQRIVHAKTAPALTALIGTAIAVTPWIIDTLYKNFFIAIGISLLCVTWAWANFLKRDELKSQGLWEQQKKVMLGALICLSAGLSLLLFYEAQMPKYSIALTNQYLYTVPPQLSTSELRALGAECNTYGDTLCSHAVFAKIVKQDPRDYFSLANLAMAQSHIGFHEYAIKNFETVLKSGLATYDIYKFYGHSLLATKNKKRAIKAYQFSLKKNPNQQQLRQKVKSLSGGQAL